MNPSPRPPYRPKTPPCGYSGSPHGLSSPLLPPSFTPGPPFHSPLPAHQPYPSPPLLPPNFSTPPPWGGGYSPVPSTGDQYFTRPHLPLSPLSSSITPASSYGTPMNQSEQNSSPGSFYSHSDMPSPMIPPQKRKRFASIGGRSGGSGRRQHNRSFRGGRGRGRGEVGIDAYYDRFMFEDPWKDLMPPTEETEEQSTHTSVESSTTPCDDERVGSQCPVVETCSDECRTLPEEEVCPSSHDKSTNDVKNV